jgi:DNA-binding NarL/FixJ family response regulator
MAQGDTSKEISEKLFLSQGTVKNYMSNIYGKISTSERAKAMIILKELKL